MNLSLLDSLRSAMADAGMPYSGELVPDGKLHRFDCTDEKGQASWYVAHVHDHFAAGQFGCWRRNLSQKWNSTNGNELTAEDRQLLRQKAIEADNARKTEEERLLSAAKVSIAKRLSAALPVTDHPYLARKKVNVYGEIRVDSDNLLLLPLRDASGSLTSMQFIAPDKRFGNQTRDKSFIFGGKLSGSFYTISDKPDGPLVICEGYATGASIHAATGWAVVCAMSAGNLTAVGNALRTRYADRTLIFAADNDRFTSENPGCRLAEAAAKAARATVAIPEFAHNDSSSTDFNDLACIEGLEVVKFIFDQALPKNTLPPIVDSAAFVALTLPLPDELVSGILHRGSKLVLGGGSKTFKTWTLVDLALSVAYAKPWLSFHTTPGRVLYLNFEIQEAFFQARLVHVAKAKGIPLIPNQLDLWNLRGHAADYVTLIPRIIADTQHRNYSLIIVDPIYKLYGNVDENAAGQVGKLLNSLESLAVQSNAAIAFGAHYSKGNQATKESIDRISGSGVFARDPDSILNFTKHTAEDSFTVESTLRNHKPVLPFVVTWNFPIFSTNAELDPADLKLKSTTKSSYYSPKILLAPILDRTHDHPISISEWAALLHIPRTTLQNYTEDLRLSGFTKTVGNGTHAKQAITEKGIDFFAANLNTPSVQ